LLNPRLWFHLKLRIFSKSEAQICSSPLKTLLHKVEKRKKRIWTKIQFSLFVTIIPFLIPLLLKPLEICRIHIIIGILTCVSFLAFF
jgi:hypothetical protein